MKSLPGVAACLVGGGVAVAAGAVGGCAAILDWNGYTSEKDASVGGTEASTLDDAADVSDGGGMLDAPDAPVAADGGGQGDARADAELPDAAFACGPSTCGGCCTDAGCAGGQSVGTCGSGGVACSDCSSLGEVCGDAGQCVAPVADAAPPPTCVVASCSVALCPALVYTTTCCKGDQTCGRQVQIPMKGPCM